MILSNQTLVHVIEILYKMNTQLFLGPTRARVSVRFAGNKIRIEHESNEELDNI